MQERGWPAAQHACRQQGDIIEGLVALYLLYLEITPACAPAEHQVNFRVQFGNLREGRG
jgi:hypothetical protein